MYITTDRVIVFTQPGIFRWVLCIHEDRCTHFECMDEGDLRTIFGDVGYAAAATGWPVRMR